MKKLLVTADWIPAGIPAAYALDYLAAAFGINAKRGYGGKSYSGQWAKVPCIEDHARALIENARIAYNTPLYGVVSFGGGHYTLVFSPIKGYASYRAVSGCNANIFMEYSPCPVIDLTEAKGNTFELTCREERLDFNSKLPVLHDLIKECEKAGAIIRDSRDAHFVFMIKERENS